MNRLRQTATVAKIGLTMCLVVGLLSCAARQAERQRLLAQQQDLAAKAQAEQALKSQAVQAGKVKTEQPQKTGKAGGDFLSQIQGRWVGENESAKWELTIQGNSLQAKTSDGAYYKSTISIRPQADPAQIDLKMTDCSDTALNGQTIEGIVKLEGKKLTICVKRPEDAERPKDFNRSQGLVVSGVKQ